MSDPNDNLALLTELQNTLLKWEQKLSAVESRRNVLRELSEDYEGFGQGVKAVMRANKRNNTMGIRGVVAELLVVPEELENAIEAILGVALQHVVVLTEGDGWEAINFLKSNERGRATFLPMDKIRGDRISDNECKLVADAKGYVGVAVELVSYDPEFSEVFSCLLGDVIVTKSLEDASRIAGMINYRYRVVTLEGEMIDVKGLMLGGGLLKNSDTKLLGHRRMIMELDQQIEVSQSEIVDLKNRIYKLKRNIAEE